MRESYKGFNSLFNSKQDKRKIHSRYLTNYLILTPKFINRIFDNQVIQQYFAIEYQKTTILSLFAFRN